MVPKINSSPAVEGLLGHADPAGSLSHRTALGYRYLGLSELVDHLPRRMSLLGRLSPFLRPYSNILSGPVLGGQVNRRSAASRPQDVAAFS